MRDQTLFSPFPFHLRIIPDHESRLAWDRGGREGKNKNVYCLSQNISELTKVHASHLEDKRQYSLVHHEQSPSKRLSALDLDTHSAHVVLGGGVGGSRGSMGS